MLVAKGGQPTMINPHYVSTKPPSPLLAGRHGTVLLIVTTQVLPC